MAVQKPYQKALCLIYILTLLLWSICSGAASISEITGTICNDPQCYVNHSSAISSYANQNAAIHSPVMHGDINHSSAITSAARHLPAPEYLSVRSANTSESLSAAENRGQRHLPRSVRQIAASFFSDNSSTDLLTLSGRLSLHEIPAHNPCGIIITNYIHLKDGQKAASFFKRFSPA